jgi:4-hydroxy-tetrahydrodipicolinate synthase
VLLGGAQDTSTARVKERVRVLAAIGYKNFVVTPPFYMKPKLEEEHLRFFGGCRESGVEMNMIPYNIPGHAGCVIPVRVMHEMASRGWINSCKESSEDLTYLSRLLTLCRPCGLRVLIGTELHAMTALLMGADGLVPVSANFEPGTFMAAYQARNEPQRLGLMQDRITKLVLNVVLGPRSWLAGVKYAVSRRGGISERPVSPTEPLNQAERAELDLFLAKEHAAFEQPDRWKDTYPASDRIT